MATQRTLLYVSIFAALSLTACGGGGGGSNNPPNNQTQSSTVTGVITGFGSIFVDGVEYETADSTISVDGTSTTEDDLAIGMVVTLTGTVNDDGTTGVASAVSYSNELEGQVISNNYLTDGTLNIMGQTIKVNAETVFESKVSTIASIEQIVAGNIIEVSGYPTANGDIYATRLEVKKANKANSDVIEVKGVISNLNTTDSTFTLGSLTVDYSIAMLDDSISALANDLYVEVKSSTALNGNTLVASKVELEGHNGSLERSGNENEDLEFEGVIVTVDLANKTFVVNGQTVYFNNATEFEYGNSANLLADVRVKVEGVFDANGRLIADEIKFKTASSNEIAGVIEAIDRDNKTVTVMGQTFSLNNSTIMDDERDDSPERYFDINDLTVGNWVEVRYYTNSTDDSLVATKFKRDDDSGDDGNDSSLEGVIESVNEVDQTFAVSGVTVNYASVANFTPIDGKKVEIEGNFESGVLVATKVEIEDSHEDENESENEIESD